MAVTSRTERNAALLLAEGALWVLLIGGVVGVLAALRDLLAGESGVWSSPLRLVGGGSHPPALHATLDPLDAQLQLPTPITGGTVDAATGLAPVTIGPPVEATVAWGDSGGLTQVELLVWQAPALIASIGVIVGSWLLLRVVRSARVGEVFTMANAVRLRWLAAVIGVAGIGYEALASWGSNWILANSAAGPHLDTSTYSMSLVPILAALVVAAVAVIWEHGVRLARDTDGLV